MTEYIIEIGDRVQFYAFCVNKPEGYIANAVITIDIDYGLQTVAVLEFEDEVRILEKETRKVIFDSTNEIWESYR